MVDLSYWANYSKIKNIPRQSPATSANFSYSILKPVLRFNNKMYKL